MNHIVKISILLFLSLRLSLFSGYVAMAAESSAKKVEDTEMAKAPLEVREGVFGGEEIETVEAEDESILEDEGLSEDENLEVVESEDEELDQLDSDPEMQQDTIKEKQAGIEKSKAKWWQFWK